MRPHVFLLREDGLRAPFILQQQKVVPPAISAKYSFLAISALVRFHRFHFFFKVQKIPAVYLG